MGNSQGGGTEDLDKRFAYDTKQLVNIQDRFLGFTQYGLQIIIMGYIVLGVFLYGEGYLEFEQTKGAIATHVRGDAVAVSSGKPGTRYFSAEEITYPGLENGNVFVATRQSVHHQKRGVCEDPFMGCATDADCTAALNGTCSSSGHCKEASWCDQEEMPQLYEIDTKNLHIWVKSSIQFSKLERNSQKDPFGFSEATAYIFSTEKLHPYPEHMVNLFSVKELLLMCKPIPVRYEEISELGAAIEVVFSWSCDVSSKKCKPEVKARRLDVLIDPDNIGYRFKWAEYIGEDERYLYEMRGVRIFLRTIGRGTMFDANSLILKLATTTSLLCVAPIIADLLMLNLFHHRKKYKARKFEVSPDFSEYMERLQKRKADRRARPVGEDDASRQQREDDWQRRLREEED